MICILLWACVPLPGDAGKEDCMGVTCISSSEHTSGRLSGELGNALGEVCVHAGRVISFKE